ncbi:MAG: hypothetical protein JSS81_14105 [Acidobacteria bacterium]|nr:hypothetical protein [Acidobacteriota bacterium]
MRNTCPICRKSYAKTTSEIFIDSKLTGYYVVLLTYRETRLQFPTCLNCCRKIARDDYFNRSGAKWIAASVVFGGIGVFCIAIDLMALFSGDRSSFFQMTPVGLFFLIPSVWAFLRCFKARRKVKEYLSLLGYAR